MRLDRFLSECKAATRSEAGKAIRGGSVTVNGQTITKPETAVREETDEITFRGRILSFRKFVYLMLNKPDGYISATEDGQDPVVTELLPAEYRKRGVFPCGRLDKHTVGLMLITDDGVLSHRLLAPAKHVSKQYAFTTRFPLSDEDVQSLEAGVDIGGYVTKPAKVDLSSPQSGTITISEGKYHQIKLMMEAVHNKITSLERISFGPLSLDPSLARGEWRELREEEIQALITTTKGTQNT